MRIGLRSSIALIASFATLAACTEVTDLWKYETLDSTTADAPLADAGDGTTTPDVNLPDVDPACDPDPCAIYNKVCISGFCGDCLPGFAPNEVTQVCEPSSDLCNPDPCAAENRICVDGQCAGCLDGFISEGGTCVPSGDPCSPDPCVSANKICVGGFCDGCLPGYFESNGQCVEPNPCLPNPCEEQYKTTCTEDNEGNAVCLCDPGAKDDGNGGCTFDPCIPDPCTDQAPFTNCTSIGSIYECNCPVGQIEQASACIPDPCVPNPCTGNKNVCSSPDGVATECACKLGFEDDGAGGCGESWATNLDPSVFEDLVDLDEGIDNSMQLFLDDFGVSLQTNMQRRLHPATKQSQTYDIGDDLAIANIGRARGGSVVFIPESVREALPDGHPLKPYEWRQYYVGYRQLWAADAQPGWLCMAVANSPLGPWTKPVVNTDAAAPHCVLLDDGITTVEVTVDGAVGFVASVTRQAVGTSATDPGMYLYTSADGITWFSSGASIVALNNAPSGAVSKYGRIGDRSRMIRDPETGLWVNLVALVSAGGGDARGLMIGSTSPASGWTKNPGVNAAPAIIGPTAIELAQSQVYGDMVAWREGRQWIGLLQKRLDNCPRTAYAVVVTSRNGQFWQVVKDGANPAIEAFLPVGVGGLDSSVDSLVGGGPLTANDEWHFYAGGLTEDICANVQAAGGIYRSSVRVGGIAGMEPVDPASPGLLVTTPMKMKPGFVGAALSLNARVDGKLTISIEALSPIDTILQATEKVVTAGEYKDVVLDMPSLVEYTADRFRIRFIFEAGGGELFGFRISDPACTPNPCVDDPEKTTCVSEGSDYTCVCTAPLHPDGLGGCTDDPCIPDPCVGLNEQGCTAEGDEAVCGCVDGYVRFDGACIPDPCLITPCLPPEDKCQALNGEAVCYCPEGSEASPTGCTETAGSYRAFVTQLGVDGANVSPAAADAVCANQALAAGLQGTYVAWVSSNAESAINRVSGGGPWRTYDPDLNLWTRLVASNPSDLTDGSLLAPINATAFGTPASDSCDVWTGTSPTGTTPPPFGPFGGNCQDWTTADQAATGLAGDCHATDISWTAAGPLPCSSTLNVYCFGMP